MAYPPGAPGGPPPAGFVDTWNPGMGGGPIPDNQMGPGPDPQLRFDGYQNVGGFGAMNAMPPPPPPPMPPSAPPMQFKTVKTLTEEETREALLQFVAEHCCYGKGAAQDCNITKITPSVALHYKLETFCEGRHTGQARVPYRGGPVDGPHNGVPPPPWQIPMQPNSLFHDHTKKTEVPHTSTVVQCNVCWGRGFLRCTRCDGRGHNQCFSCHGSGRDHYTDAEGHQHVRGCGRCGGDGRTRCHTCGGDGRVTCHTCKGYRQLRCFIELTVIFKNHTEDFILEGTDLPDHLVTQVRGDMVFEQTLLQCWPIVGYPIIEVNQNSIRLVEKHKSAFPSERQLQQRQTLRAIPVTECDYDWKDTNTRFWVYGLDQKVWAPDYPQQCCWGCEII